MLVHPERLDVEDVVTLVEGAVGAVVEVAPWSRIPETRALVVPRDVR